MNGRAAQEKSGDTFPDIWVCSKSIVIARTINQRTKRRIFITNRRRMTLITRMRKKITYQAGDIERVIREQTELQAFVETLGRPVDTIYHFSERDYLFLLKQLFSSFPAEAKGEVK